MKHMILGANRGQKRSSDLLEVEICMTESLVIWMVGTKFRFSVREVCVIKH